MNDQELLEVVLANWAKDFEAAAAPDEVLGIVNDYLRTLPSGMASWLPRASRPSEALASAAEIRTWHAVIARECAKPGAFYNSRLQEHAVIFLCAVRRLDELAGTLARGRGAKAGTSSSTDPA